MMCLDATNYGFQIHRTAKIVVFSWVLWTPLLFFPKPWFCMSRF